MGKLKITSNPKTGQVFTLAVDEKGQPKLDKNGERHGYFRVEERNVNLAFAYNKAVETKSALVSISEKAYNEAKNDLVAGLEVPGRIQTVESLTKEPGMQEKMAGDSGVACTLGGKQIYRTTRYDASGESQDILIAHDNDVKAEIEAKAKAAAMNK